MPRPTETALRGRARALLEAMTERALWTYAVPRDDGPAAVREAALAAGLRADPADGARWLDARGEAAITARDDEALDVLLVTARGEDAMPALAQILDKAGFYAQSTLLGTAHDVRDEEAPSALGTLAHMVVAWDDAWRELFQLHLGAADPVVRRDAAAALVTAAAAAGAAPAIALLEAAAAKEKVAEVQAAMAAALAKVRG